MSEFKNNIALLGAMKAVNLAVGRLLAEDMQMTFIDTDDAIEKQYGMSIGCIIDDYKLPYYYSLENKFLKESNFKNSVLSTSGSLFMKPENIYNLDEDSYIVLLVANDPTTRLRITNDKNYPLKNDVLRNLDAIRSVLETRGRENATLVIDTTNKPAEEVAKEIKKKLMSKIYGQV